MPFITPDAAAWRRTASRKLVVGPPNSGKTTSLLTAKKPVHIISYPGEMGANSLPRGDGYSVHVWEGSPETQADSKAVLAEVRQLTVDILSGKLGECRTFVGDGLHKLGYYHLDSAANGTWFKGKDFQIERSFGKIDPYSKSYSTFEEYLRLVYQSQVENVIFTCWDGTEPGQYAGVKVEGGRVYPGLHGQLAKKIMGMFSFVLYAQMIHKMVGTKFIAQYLWQLKETKDVAGAAIKLNPKLVAKLPDVFEQDWTKLDELLEKLEEAV